MIVSYAIPALLAFILTVAAAGTIAASGAAHDTRPADGWDWPTAIGVSSVSEVFVGVLNARGGSVSRLAADGEWIGAWLTDGPMEDLAVGHDNTVYTAMYRSSRVYRFAPDGGPDGQWQAGYNVNQIATGPLGATVDGSVYVLWTPQRIGEPPSGPPRITRYAARGEKLAEWAVGPRAYDLTVAVTDAAPDGIVYVADAGGLIGRYAPDGSPRGEWRAGTAEERSIAAGPTGITYMVFQPATGEAGQLWRYTSAGDGSLACTLPIAAPRDVAVDPREGDIYVLYPDSVLRLAPDCTVLARFSHEQLRGVATATPGTANPSATLAQSPTPIVTVPPTDTPRPTSTMPTAAAVRPLFVPYAANGIERSEGASFVVAATAIGPAARPIVAQVGHVHLGLEGQLGDRSGACGVPDRCCTPRAAASSSLTRTIRRGQP